MTTSIYFIDSRVADIEALVAAMPADSLWYVLDATQDGIEQIRAIVAGYSELQAIHIVSHGVSGSVLLGSTWLSSANLHDHAAALAQIGSSLSADGDLLLYGCNVAQGEVGVGFVNSLALITGADVAASNDQTGASALGGDWMLEAATSSIEASGIASSEYAGTLSVDTIAPTLTGLKLPSIIDLSADSKIITFDATAQDHIGGSGTDRVVVILDKHLTFSFGAYRNFTINYSVSTDTFSDGTPMTSNTTRTITTATNPGWL